MTTPRQCRIGDTLQTVRPVGQLDGVNQHTFFAVSEIRNTDAANHLIATGRWYV